MWAYGTAYVCIRGVLVWHCYALRLLPATSPAMCIVSADGMALKYKSEVEQPCSMISAAQKAAACQEDYEVVNSNNVDHNVLP